MLLCRKVSHKIFLMKLLSWPWLCAILVSVTMFQAAWAADWPMFQADAARSGYTPEPLPQTLYPAWCHRTAHPPQPAWPTSERLTFDRACQPVIADGVLYFASSADDQVVALDAATGTVRWSCFMDAPVRFAPAVWKDRVLVAGDDGFLHCFDAVDGRVHWKFRGGPRADMLLGNERMIFRWPARGGPVIVDDIVYFGAGIWPSEGIYIYALDAATGKKLWVNDSSGSIVMNQPHGGARAKSGVAAQGHFAAAGDTLLVPTGRAVPAAFDRTTGEFRYFHLQVNTKTGGSEATIIDSHFFNGGTMFALTNGASEVTLRRTVIKKAVPEAPKDAPAVRVAAHPQWIVFCVSNQVTAVDRRQPLSSKQVVDKKGKKGRAPILAKTIWNTILPVGDLGSLIVAGDTIVCGGKNQVFLLDAASGQIKQSLPVNGSVFGLAASGGRLYASTDQGRIHCFDGKEGKDQPEISVVLPDANPIYASSAEEILRTSGVTEGYALDLGCGEGWLALELAKRTKLRIYGVDADPAKVQAARQMLQAAGLYGRRVTIHQADPATVPYPDYFADLVVSGRNALEKTRPPVVTRMLRPNGGKACFWHEGVLQQSVRGPLAGAGDWTHLYADPANTLCSGDTRLRDPLAMLWFRDVDQSIPSRHGRGPGPLVADGRMYLEGMNTLRAINIYNGTVLWEFKMPGGLKPYNQDHLTGVAATGSNLCLGEDEVYLRFGGKCHVVNNRTGRQTAVWDAPPQPDGQPGTWGYLAYRDRTLFGTLVNKQHLLKESWTKFLGKLDMTSLFSESLLLFAMDSRTGKVKWTFKPEHFIRHNTIAVGAKRMYVIDRPLAKGDSPKVKATTQPGGRLVCLDTLTGKRLWEIREDIFGTVLILSEKHDVLLMTYQPTRFKLGSELDDRMTAFRARDGRQLWSVTDEYKSRPIINDRTIYAEPGKWDLLTGERQPFEFARSYGCGILAGASRMLVFRSATLGYVDLEKNTGTENYGGIRPGCWVNAIPAGGLLLLGEAASGCTCSYLNQAAIALQPRAK